MSDPVVRNSRLARAYVHKEALRELIGQPIEWLDLHEAVFVDTSEEGMAVLQSVLADLAPTLTVLNLTESNCTGQFFYKGKEIPVEEGEMVTIEAYDDATRAQVRDVAPPMDVEEQGGKARYRYVRTQVNSNSNPHNPSFSRCYVLLDWLPNVKTLRLPKTNISGYGLTSLIAATASNLRELDVSQCEQLDDRGMHAIATLCKQLHVLKLDKCPRVTTYGLIFLGQLPAKQVKKLKEIHCSPDTTLKRSYSHHCLAFNARVALFHELQGKGFTGKMVTRNTLKNSVDTWIGTRAESISRLFEKHRGHKLFDAARRDLGNVAGFPNPLKAIQVMGGEEAYELDLTDHLITDSVLCEILKRKGFFLRSLKLDGTYITGKGLEYLKFCPNLRALHLCRLRNVLYKREANLAVMPAITSMHLLNTLHICETRLSGRMLSEHRNLKLRVLHAKSCPVSAHAIRMLANSCASSMEQLNLSGCRFINRASMQFLLMFRNLRTLDLSFCTGLKKEDVQTLEKWPAGAIDKLELINVTGVPGMDEKACQTLAHQLATIRKDHPTRQPVTIVGTSEAMPREFKGESAMEQCAYQFIHGGVESLRIDQLQQHGAAELAGNHHQQQHHQHHQQQQQQQATAEQNQYMQFEGSQLEPGSVLLPGTLRPSATASSFLPFQHNNNNNNNNNMPSRPHPAPRAVSAPPKAFSRPDAQGYQQMCASHMEDSSIRGDGSPSGGAQGSGTFDLGNAGGLVGARFLGNNNDNNSNNSSNSNNNNNNNASGQGAAGARKLHTRSQPTTRPAAAQNSPQHAGIRRPMSMNASQSSHGQQQQQQQQQQDGAPYHQWNADDIVPGAATSPRSVNSP